MRGCPIFIKLHLKTKIDEVHIWSDYNLAKMVKPISNLCKPPMNISSLNSEHLNLRFPCSIIDLAHTVVSFLYTIILGNLVSA